MIPGHHACDAKHQLDAKLTLKVWTLVVSTRCIDETPVQTGDAKVVETCCKLAVQAATWTAEGGRTHWDGQRSV